jgi:hypothetical protein
MSQYRRPTEPKSAVASEMKICSNCGHPVSPGDRYCSGCGAAFGGVLPRAQHVASLPGFEYHLVQGLGWGCGFMLAGGVVALIVSLLAALSIRSL